MEFNRNLLINRSIYIINNREFMQRIALLHCLTFFIVVYRVYSLI